MFELIFLIIIIAVIRNKVEKLKNTKSSAQTRQTPPRQTPPRKTPPRQTPRQQQTKASKPAPAKAAPTVNSQIVAQEKSTTEMLREKALQDDREEMRDKHEQRMKNKKYYGDHNYAQKYLIGDPVPKDKRMVYCPYCNAENLIPSYSRANSYNCYFCREEL
nr:hypothetical protein [Lachnospiraceae bacterium]